VAPDSIHDGGLDSPRGHAKNRGAFAYVVVCIVDGEFEGELLVYMCRCRAVASEPPVANAVAKVWTQQRAKQVSVSQRCLAVVPPSVLCTGIWFYFLKGDPRKYLDRCAFLLKLQAPPFSTNNKGK
jgi:hypothetical protein